MTKLTAAQKRFFQNATLNIAAQLIFRKLEDSNFPKRPLGDLCTVCRGGSPRPKGDPKYFGGSIPWIMISDASNSPGRYICSTKETVTEEGAKKSRLLKAGTLVVTNSATIGLPKILGVDGCIHDGFLGFLNLSEDIESDFLYYFFIYIRTYLEKIAPETTQKNLNTSIASNLKLPILNTDIQKSISKFLEIVESRQQGLKKDRLPNLPFPLSDVTEIVTRVEELVGKIEAVRSLRQKALKETEALLISTLNLIFEENINKHGWELKPLRQAAEVARGKFTHRPRNDPRFYGGNIPFIQIGDISNSNRYIKEYSQTLNQDGLRISRMFPKGSIVIAITGATIGVTGILSFDCCFPDSIVGIVPNKDSVIPEFIYWSLEYVKKVALAEATQTTQPNINLQILDKLNIPVPPLSEQRRIATYLNKIQTKIEIMKPLREEAIKEIDALLPSILDKAFKGELQG